jgi:WXXGXW repeat (2 copies)
MKKFIYFYTILVVIIFSSCGPTAVVVRQQPVAPVYVRPVAPSRTHVWVEGSWVGSRRHGYKYRRGYYALPPRGRSNYTPGYWVRGRNGYYWQNGRW